MSAKAMSAKASDSSSGNSLRNAHRDGTNLLLVEQSGLREPFFEFLRLSPAQNRRWQDVRYYFDFEDHYRISDKRGEVCQTLDDARTFARVFARELAKSRPANAMQAEHVVVFDESGHEVYRTPIPKDETDSGEGTQAAK